jgi:oligopeptide transport system ATP-binding protein
MTENGAASIAGNMGKDPAGAAGAQGGNAIAAEDRKVILSVRDLAIRFSLRGRILKAIRGASLDLYEGETLAIVGESGSGKSVFTKSFLGMLDQNGWVESGSVLFEGEDLAKFRTEKDWMRIRGKKISMVFQDPMTALNPLRSVGRQIGEVIEMHQGLSGEAVEREVVEILKRVGIPEPETRCAQYPHEFSGGMRQRVVIAIAMACKPKILICDEPTTALDVTIQAQILELIAELQAALGTAVVLVTHDLGVVAGTADRVAVMYAGRIVEEGTTAEVFANPLHPYTRGLLASLPRIDTPPRGRLEAIPGLPPDLGHLPPGCPFHPRCGLVSDRCRQERPPVVAVSPTHRAECFEAGAAR